MFAFICRVIAPPTTHHLQKKMGFLGIIRFFARWSFEITVVLLLLVFLPRVPPDVNISTPFTVKPTRPFEGALTLNNKLEDVEQWHKGEMHGPEAFVDRNGVLYTGLHGGDVVKLVGQHITPVVKFGKPCKGFVEEKVCGRPLGMDFDKDGALYVCDCYYGLYKVDVESGKYERIVEYGEVIGGHNVTLPNGVAVAENGDIFWSDSSTQFDLQDGVYDLLADGSGRLIHYDPKSKKHTVLISNLRFPNGIALPDDESFVLVSETFMNRLHRYWLKGPKKGTYDIFIDGLPGMPDNLKKDGKGGFLVPLIVSIDHEHPQYVQALGPYPLIRKLLARLLGITEFTFQLFDEIYPNEYSKWAVHFLGHFESVKFMYHKRTSVLHLSKEGEILDSLHSLNGKLLGISEAHIFGDTLYLGSPFNDFIGRIPLAKVGWEHLSKKEGVKMTESATTTTTTPKPTTQKPAPAQKQSIKDQPKAVPVKETPKKN